MSVRNPSAALASAVLLQAVEDARDYLSKRKIPAYLVDLDDQRGATPRKLLDVLNVMVDDLVEFIDSSWCAELCDAADIETGSFRRKMFDWLRIARRVRVVRVPKKVTRAADERLISTV